MKSLNEEKTKSLVETINDPPTTTKSSSIIKLNVGGQLFTTTTTTLNTYDDSFLSSIIKGDIPSETDDDGNIFIDRNPVLFKYVLSYLRGELLDFNHTDVSITSFIKEADYYCIDIAKEQIIEKNPCGQTKMLCEQNTILKEQTKMLYELVGNLEGKIKEFGLHLNKKEYVIFDKLKAKYRKFLEVAIYYDERDLKAYVMGYCVTFDNHGFHLDEYGNYKYIPKTRVIKYFYQEKNDGNLCKNRFYVLLSND